MSANSDSESVQEALGVGMNDFLAKPLNFDSLVSQVKALTE
jgi:DNA-binding response OmpR family regulator